MLEAAAPELPESDDAKEGTAAHWVAEMVLSDQVGTVDELIDRAAPNGVIVSESMVEHVQFYIDHARSRGVPFEVEKPIHFENGNIVVDGTADLVTYDKANRILYIDDLKFGYRFVDPVENWQLIAYAIGAFQTAEFMQAKRIVMSIVQPRAYHASGPVRSWKLSVGELNERYMLMQEFGQRIAEPNPKVVTGPWCLYCSAFSQCPAAQAAGMNAVDETVKAFTDELSDTALAWEMRNLTRAREMIEMRITSLSSLAESRIKHGAAVPGWALEQKFGNRAWIKGANADMLEMITGKSLTEKKLITPAAAERAGVPKETVEAFTTKPSRGFKLVQADLDRKAKEVFNG